MNKRGLDMSFGQMLIGIILFIVIAFLIAVGSGLTIKISNLLTSTVNDNAPETFGFKNATATTFGNFNTGLSQLSFFSWILILASFLGVLILAYNIKPSTINIFMWFLSSAVLFLVGVYISRAYENMYNASDFVSQSLQSTQYGTSWLIIHMPHLVVLLAFFGGIILFMRMKQQEDDKL